MDYFRFGYVNGIVFKRFIRLLRSPKDSPQESHELLLNDFEDHVIAHNGDDCGDEAGSQGVNVGRWNKEKVRHTTGYENKNANDKLRLGPVRNALDAKEVAGSPTDEDRPVNDRHLQDARKVARPVHCFIK